MSARDLTIVALRTLAVWLFASGLAGLCSSWLTWAPDVATYGVEVTTWRLAAASIFVPIAALVWLSSHAAARLSFPAPTQTPGVSLGRGDLYAFASVLVGLYLLSDVLPQVVYWLVIWRSSRGTGFWNAISDGTMPNSVVYWVQVRAEAGRILAKTVVGVALLVGPDRLRAGVVRLRRELTGSLSEVEADTKEGAQAREGGG